MGMEVEYPPWETVASDSRKIVLQNYTLFDMVLSGRKMKQSYS